MVTIPRTVTIQLQRFLPYTNLAPKNSHLTAIWLSNIIRNCPWGQWGGWVWQRLHVEDNLRWKTVFGGRQSSVEDDLLCKVVHQLILYVWFTSFSSFNSSVLYSWSGKSISFSFSFIHQVFLVHLSCLAYLVCLADLVCLAHLVVLIFNC